MILPLQSEKSSVPYVVHFQFLFFFVLKKKSSGSAEKNRVSWDTVNQPNFYFGLTVTAMHRQDRIKFESCKVKKKITHKMHLNAISIAFCMKSES